MYALMKIDLDKNLPCFLNDENHWEACTRRVHLFTSSEVFHSTSSEVIAVDRLFIQSNQRFVVGGQPYSFEVVEHGQLITLNKSASIEYIRGSYLACSQSPEDLYKPRNIAILRAYFNQLLNESFEPVVGKLVELLKEKHNNSAAA